MIEFMESMAVLCVYIARNDSTEGGHEAAKPQITLSKWRRDEDFRNVGEKK